MKAKVLLALALLLALTVPSLAENDVIYLGHITRRYATSTTSVYAEMDKDSEVIKRLNPGADVEITAVYPNWIEIQVGRKKGYVLRHRVDVDEAADPVHTPPYPITPHQFYAVIDRTVPVMSEKSTESEVLSTLTEGAKIAILGVEDGWAQLIHKRQYGYVDTRLLTELYPVASSLESADPHTPIAVFTSFYKDNPLRINNLAVACGFISKVMQPGESMNFNETVGPFNAERGYEKAPVLVNEEVKSNYGGGSCQVSSTLWDTLMQLPGITVTMRKPHGDNGAPYLPHGMDASSGTKELNFIFRNDYDFPIRIEASTHDLALFMAVYKEEP